MSTPFDPVILTRRTAATMLTQEWRLVNAVGDNDMDLAGAGGVAIGALTNDVATGVVAAVFLPVQVGGIIKVICGGAGTAGAACTSDANGAAVNAGAGARVFGIALETHVAGDIGAFLVANGGQLN